MKRPSLSPRARWWGRLAVEALVVLALVFVVQAWRTRAHVDPGAAPPPLEVVTLDGRPVERFPPPADATLVHFWATWCTVCKQEIGTLNAIHEGLEGTGRQLVAVVDTDDIEEVRAFVAERRIQYPVYVLQRRVPREWAVTAYPTNYYLDARGRVVSSDLGLSTRWGMRWRLWRASR